MKNHIYHKMIEAGLVFLLALMQIASSQADLVGSMQKLKISSELIPVSSYTKQIKVELNGNTIKPGDPVPAKNFKNLDFSKITWDEKDPETRHTLLLLDLDRKSGPNTTQSIYNQFTSLNIPGSAISGGQIITAFDSPSVPCQPSTKHRLVLLAFRQEQSIDIMDMTYIAASTGPSKKRENFDLGEFIRRHRLELVAANVFSAIGDVNGICSASATIDSFAILRPILMVMTLAGLVGSLGANKRYV